MSYRKVGLFVKFFLKLEYLEYFVGYPPRLYRIELVH